MAATESFFKTVGYSPTHFETIVGLHMSELKHNATATAANIKGIHSQTLHTNEKKLFKSESRQMMDIHYVTSHTAKLILCNARMQ